MGKFLLELALFAGILCQIYMLVGHIGPGDQTKEQSAITLASMEAMYKGGTYSMDPYEMAPSVSNGAVLQEMARKEAERIVRTGDYESFQKQIEDNGAVLGLMGYTF